ncbi:hypothetical protein MRX96_047407 [Rhipicephalus microplus]
MASSLYWKRAVRWRLEARWVEQQRCARGLEGKSWSAKARAAVQHEEHSSVGNSEAAAWLANTGQGRCLSQLNGVLLVLEEGSAVATRGQMGGAAAVRKGPGRHVMECQSSSSSAARGALQRWQQ